VAGITLVKRDNDGKRKKISGGFGTESEIKV
jgi:hypothetical protein